MNSALINAITASFAKELPDKELRDAVKVGDTVIAHTKIIVSKKIQKSLTTAEKQQLKKAQSTGKTLEEIQAQNLKSQPFRGVIIATKGYGSNRKIVIRKIGADNVGVEKIIPLYSPVLERIELVATGKPRRAKLYYLRDRVGRKALKVRGTEQAK